MTEVNLSELERTWRIDAEFFQQRHILLAERLRKITDESVAGVASVADGNHFSISSSFVDEGIPYYRGQDVVGHFFIEQAVPNSITQEAFDQPFMVRSHLQLGNVLLSIVGTVGETSLVKTDQKATCSCKLAILRPQGISPEYLATYLSSPIGKMLSERWQRGAVQKGLLLEDMDQVPVARFSTVFEEAVKAFVNQSFNALENGRDLLFQSEQSLLKALKLDNWTPPTPLSYVRSSSDAFSAGRLDAEHFQVQYDDIEQKIKRNKCGHTSIGELAQDLMNGAEVREYQEKGVAYLRVGDLKNLDIDPNSVVRIDPVSAEKGLEKIPLRKGNVLVSRSGSLAVTAVVEPEWEDALISSHLIRLRIKDERIDPYFLALFLSSLPGKKQILKWSNGGVQPEISQPSLSNILVPVLDANIQQEIRKNILLSREERQKAKSLLDAAKRAVEIAIEDSEAAALAYLQGVV